uniref:Ribonuclease P/MRP subunit p30 n=1 Tax=Podarcis muralis TaxID=64176 RepID=A0A670HPE5_PODMU
MGVEALLQVYWAKAIWGFKVNTNTLNCAQKCTGSQCRSFKTGVTWTRRPLTVTNLAATFWISCGFWGKSKPIKILSRLTLVVSDPSHCNILRSTSTNIKFYDIFAVFPKSGKLFHVACTTLDVDIVCINVTEKLPFYIKRPSVNVAIDRGIYFELIYVPAIKDSTMRRYTVSNALSLMQICRGKVRLKMSRFAPLLFRQNFPPPFQLMLGWLFGLSESNAKAAVSTNGRAVLLHGGKLEQ